MHLALIGYGSIGKRIVAWLADHPVQQLTIMVRSGAIGQTLGDPALAQAAKAAQVTDDIGTLMEGKPDLVVECAGQAVVAAHGPVILTAGLDLVVVSVGALADNDLRQRLAAASEAGRAELILPPGAIGGLDLLSTLALAGDVQVTYRGTKPPQAWRGTPAEDLCDLSYLRQPTTFFDDSARDAARLYPKNANVAATLALAAGSFDRTRVQLIADPDATGNAHSFDVRSPAGSFSMQIESSPSADNAKTSVTTAFSVISEIIRKRAALAE
ncbi:putative L-aspartate dehydrogenase 2 [Roseobacter cerasinus]|uniref:L-aspartate dehydrogenase n=1 Tax=Roseobacter cerasinus TaxID=2602289 RepID=A0A640VUQ5_9RHOB|nr:aspartate dehydrogenase [Roseobacter cerasinus]GFE51587.1 putative L-aspartate dehydrogenase 2 [Roseobacter cerasinus]